MDGLQAFCVSAGAKSAAKDLKILSDVLKPHLEKSVDAFCSEAKIRLNQGLEKSKSRKTAPRAKRAAR